MSENYSTFKILHFFFRNRVFNFQKYCNPNNQLRALTILFRFWIFFRVLMSNHSWLLSLKILFFKSQFFPKNACEYFIMISSWNFSKFYEKLFFLIHILYFIDNIKKWLDISTLKKFLSLNIIDYALMPLFNLQYFKKVMRKIYLRCKKNFKELFSDNFQNTPTLTKLFIYAIIICIMYTVICFSSFAVQFWFWIRCCFCFYNWSS